MIKANNKSSGFTLIEMIVSVGVFSIVVTTAVGALLVIISTNKQLQEEQNVMTNLSFALDSMTREFRTGFAYVCGSGNAYNANIFPWQSKIFQSSGFGDEDHDDMDHTVIKDCPNGKQSFKLHGVSFMEGGSSITGATSNRILYYFDQVDPNDKKLMRRVGNDKPQSIVSSGLEIVDANFIVTGSIVQGGPWGDDEQPTVTIYIEAKAKDDPNAKTYRLQTTVTQRILDL